MSDIDSAWWNREYKICFEALRDFLAVACVYIYGHTFPPKAKMHGFIHNKIRTYGERKAINYYSKMENIRVVPEL